MLRPLLLAIAFVALLPFTLLRAGFAALRRRRIVLEVVLEGRHLLRPMPTSPFSRRQSGISRRSLAWALREAGRDPAVQTIWLRIGHLTGGYGELNALREAVRRVRASGRRVVASLGHADTRSLYVASAADEILVSPHVTVDAAGMSLELTFFGEALGKIGVGLDVITAGAYKSAMESFTRDAPSEASAEAVDALLTSLYDTVVSALASRPGPGGAPRDPAAVRAALESGPMLAPDALKCGLVDALTEEEGVPVALDCHPKGKSARVRVESYSGPSRPWPKFRFRRPRLAVVEIHGNITDGRLDDAEPTAGANAAAVCQALERAQKDRRVRGVLLHVDSRGGSATASERMWRGVRALAASKPVIACMGDYAASGGYYVASAAHGIVAAPGTLTGSIGVIAAKPVAAGLFERLGIHHTRFERGENSSLFSLARRFTDSQRVRVEQSVRHFYTLFLGRVAEGRGKTPADIAPVAEGRVWTGVQARERGLIDRLGDEQAAIEWLSEKTGVDATPGLLVIGPRVPFARRMMPKLFGAQLARLQDADGPVGEALALLQLADNAEGVIAYSPLRLRR